MKRLLFAVGLTLASQSYAEENPLDRLDLGAGVAPAYTKITSVLGESHTYSGAGIFTGLKYGGDLSLVLSSFAHFGSKNADTKFSQTQYSFKTKDHIQLVSFAPGVRWSLGDVEGVDSFVEGSFLSSQITFRFREFENEQEDLVEYKTTTQAHGIQLTVGAYGPDWLDRSDFFVALSYLRASAGNPKLIDITDPTEVVHLSGDDARLLDHYQSLHLVLGFTDI